MTMTATPTSRSMVTLQVWRLELRQADTNTFKQYTAFTDGRDACFFGFSRIGSTWQWSIKSGGDAAGRCQSQMMAKYRGGYSQVWQGDLTVPTTWASDPKSHARQLQDMAEDAARKGAPSASVPTDVPDGGEQKVAGPLESLLDDCRATVSKMAVSPDAAMEDYSRLVGQVERATDDLDVVNGYLDTLRLMIGAAQ